jgi:D-alanyl-D-alanine carboxypeptidase
MGAPARLQTTLRLLPLLFLLAACGQQGGYGSPQYGALPYGGIGESPSLAPSRYYAPPGPPEDPWGPYIREAAGRYRVPEQWVRAVMHQESGGEEQAVSPVGAMGLMQVMPNTYEGLRVRYGLGADPYQPRDNILAGTAYIREMYDRYGAPGFLAGYNAGPDRVDSYLAGAAELPDETVNYLAAITPNLGDAVPLSGPFAVYASARSGGVIGTAPSIASLAAGCDLNRAYDPNHPCTTLEQAAAAFAPLQQAFAQQTGANGCNLDIAYDPSHPCTSLSQVAAAVQPQPAPAPLAAAPQSAPLQVAAASVVPPEPVPVPPAGTGGCDMNVAYDPSHPCTSVGQAAAAPPPPQQAFVQEAAAAGCDPDVAFDPDHPCMPAPQPAQPPQLAAAGIQLAAAGGCDPNVAFDPDRPCTAASGTPSPPVTGRPLTSFARYQPAPPPNRPTRWAAQAGADHLLAIPTRDWAIQVGAFANPRLARAVAEGARAEAPDQLRSAALALPPTPNGGSVLYRARLVHLSASAASGACWRLNQRQLPCVVVQPNRS